MVVRVAVFIFMVVLVRFMALIRVLVRRMPMVVVLGLVGRVSRLGLMRMTVLVICIVWHDRRRPYGFGLSITTRPASNYEIWAPAAEMRIHASTTERKTKQPQDH